MGKQSAARAQTGEGYIINTSQKDPSGSGWVDQLVMTNGNEASTQIIPATSNWVINPFRGWLNDTQLILYPTTIDSIGTYIILNPFTSLSYLFSPALPNLTEYKFGWWGAEQDPLYDPSLTRVVYYAYSPEATPFPDHSGAVVLRDLQSGEELWSLAPYNRSYRSTHITRPSWSLDGTQFAFFANTGRMLPGSQTEAGMDLFVVSRDGHEQMIDSLILPRPNDDAADINWSPDGNSIAFYVLDGDLERLLVLDLQTRQIWDPCVITPYVEEYPPEVRGGIMWSPDSHQLLPDVSYTNKTIEYLVVDVVRKEVATLNFEYQAAAWLVPHQDSE